MNFIETKNSQKNNNSRNHVIQAKTHDKQKHNKNIYKIKKKITIMAQHTSD